MKAALAIQLIMKAAANAATVKNPALTHNLNPLERGGEIKNRLKLKKPAANPDAL